MKWPWGRRPLASGGREAREAAERALAQTKAETEWYRQLSRDLREIREENGLATAFVRAAGRGQR